MFAAGQELANQGKQAHDKALAEALASTKQGDEGFVAAAEQINKKRYAALVGIVDPSIRDRINAAYDQQIRDAVNRANAQYRGGSSGGVTRQPKADPLASLSSMVAGLTTKSLQVPGDTALTAYVQGVAKLIDEFDKDMQKKGADANRATALYQEGIARLGATLDETRKKQQALTDQAVAAYTASLDKANEALQRQIDAQVASVGMGAKEYQQQQQLNQVYADAADRLRELALARDQGIANGNADAQEIYKRDVDALNKSTA